MPFAIKHGLFKLNVTDYHAILGVPINADAKQIRLQYLKIAQKLHPDTCKADDTQKKLASDILSKLVNPAYKQLSRKNSYAEYQLILTQLGQRLAKQADKVTVGSEIARELLKAGNKIELVYHKLVKNLVKEQYKSLEQVTNYIAQLSELNLVYLMLTQGQKNKRETSASIAKNNQAPGKPQNNPSPNKSSQETNNEVTPQSRVDSYIRRAKEYMTKGSFAMAVSELRAALKIDPNHITGHGLLGKAYLQQNQLTMAKVHINKAWTANPQDPVAIEAKQLLDKLNKTKSTNINNKSNLKSSARASADRAKTQSGSGSIFSGLFGAKKK